MEYTQNYALRKPGLNEYANVGDLNFNADKIDSQMKKNQDVDGEVYDPTTTSSNAYEAGDYVINPDDGLMYVCNGTTYGTWDATKWDHTTEFEEIQKAMASGGESELANLHDVDITNPTEGQVLTYDEQNDEWVNSDLPDADVTKEASGNPIEFSDGADAPLVKCVTQITGYQQGSGTPSPDNIRPITAYTENTISVGGNEYSGADNLTVFNSGTSIVVQANNKRLVSKGVPVNNNDLVLIKYDNTQFKLASMFYYDNPTITVGAIANNQTINLENTSGEYKFTATNGGYVYFYFVPNIDRNVSPSELSDSIVCVMKTTTHTTYPSAIYRGSEDVVKGEVTSDYVKIVLDGTQGNFSLIETGRINIDNFTTDNYLHEVDKLNYITNLYECLKQTGSNQDFSTLASGKDCVCNLSSNTISVALRIKDARFTDVATAKSILANEPLEIAYELATPTTSSVTPTNLPIKSLSGYTHIESSTGEMEIEYFPAKEQPLIDLIPEASNMHAYSTAEHAVGTWIDGETIYERSIDLGSFSIGSGGTYIIEEATDIDLLIDYDGYVIESSIMYALPDPSIRIKMESNKDLIFSGTASWSVTSGYLTIRYTKTSSNNRSLAKSTPQEEQVEELKEEPTEETKEEPTEEVKEEPEEIKEEPVEEVKEEVKEEETIDPETNEEEKR